MKQHYNRRNWQIFDAISTRVFVGERIFQRRLSRGSEREKKQRRSR